MNKRTQAFLAAFIILFIVVVDQIIKVEVKTTMSLHDSHRITDWFYISFIENNGMAFGMSFIPKIVLTLFRLVAICFGVWAVWNVILRGINKGKSLLFTILLSMILAGAAGNLIDCIFYGQIFSASTPFSISQFVSFGDGYAPLLEGRVVDMFYFPLIVTKYPDWFPFWGGQDFIFFSPVFNFADASISVGVVALLLFCRKELEDFCQMLGVIGKREEDTEDPENSETSEHSETSKTSKHSN